MKHSHDKDQDATAYRSILSEMHDERVPDDEVLSGKENGPVWYAIPNERLIALQRSMETGECGRGSAVIAALDICFSSRIAVPKWVRDECYRLSVLASSGEAKSWDDLMDPPVPKGKSLGAIRKRLWLAPELYSNVIDLRLQDPCRPIDGTMFEEAGEPIGIGKTLAQDYYYWYIRQPENEGLHEYCLEEIEAKKAHLQRHNQ